MNYDAIPEILMHGIRPPDGLAAEAALKVQKECGDLPDGT